MSTTTFTLTEDKFKEIYTNKKFRNEVASAYGCYTAFPECAFKHLTTCSYPISYIVTQEQKAKAEELRQQAKTEAINQNTNNLVFVTMGMDYDVLNQNNVGNHRVRCTFLNSKGEKYFIEFSKASREGYNFHIDFSIKFDIDDEKHYNYSNLEREETIGKGDYSMENILKIVNNVFDCNFKNIIIDRYDLGPDDLICESPKTSN